MTAAELPGASFLQYVLESLVEDVKELKIESVEDDLGILHTI